MTKIKKIYKGYTIDIVLNSSYRCIGYDIYDQLGYPIKQGYINNTGMPGIPSEEIYKEFVKYVDKQINNNI